MDLFAGATVDPLGLANVGEPCWQSDARAKLVLGRIANRSQLRICGHVARWRAEGLCHVTRSRLGLMNRTSGSRCAT